MDTYVIWAGILGALSAISLLIGSLIGVTARLPLGRKFAYTLAYTPSSTVKKLAEKG